eukprot:TRINITY_DN21119_c0_g1_i1.p1 TRINITY_DN21119_c0_g1~~TRINITY_DN21119_c0_g1_i1.p1  ORF type:complete len:261 (-),score=52.11 TRINITY_DN21119_c0_g1_i1:6-695(-)
MAWQPQVDQVQIENFIVQRLWSQHAAASEVSSPLDYKQWCYVNEYGGSITAWCDGWSYALTCNHLGRHDTFDGSALAEVWRAIHDAIVEKAEVPKVVEHKAVELARVAVGYHVKNFVPKWDQAARAQEETDLFVEAGYGGRRPDEHENWSDIDDVRRVFSLLDQDGKSVRLTQPEGDNAHDMAIRRIRKGQFVVAETEKHGVQMCDLAVAMEILMAAHALHKFSQFIMS